MRHPLQFQSLKGFSLVELLVTMAVASGLILAVSLYVADTVKSAGQAEKNIARAADLNGVFRVLQRDVAQTGTGISVDLFTQSNANFLSSPSAQNTVDQYLEFIVQDINNTAAPDELRLGGVGMMLSPAAHKVLHIDNYSPGTGILTVRRPDCPTCGPAYNPADPTFLEPDPNLDQLFIIRPSLGSLTPAGVPVPYGPAPIIVEPSAGVLEVAVDNAIFTTPPDEGDYATFRRPIGGLFSGAIGQVRWFVDANNQLIRRTIPDVVNSAATFADQVMLDNVVDFQTSFLVWPGADAGSPDNRATWFDHILNEPLGTGVFSDARYTGSANAGTPLGDRNRFFALQLRSMGVRVRILYRVRRGNDDEQGNAFNLTSAGAQVVTVDDRNNNIAVAQRDQFNYYLYEGVFDPVNLRLKSPNVPTVAYRPVRSAQYNGRLVLPSGKFGIGVDPKIEEFGL